MNRLPNYPHTPPPPSDLERLHDALEILNDLDCEYDVRWRKREYTRKVIDGQEQIHIHNEE